MKNHLFTTCIFAFLSLISNHSFCQGPVIQWQNTIGGDDYDYLNAIIQTTDGGYIATGESSTGISGDKTFGLLDEFGGYADTWIVKLNSMGDIEWQQVIGTMSIDQTANIEQTIDGGYIAGSTTGNNYYLCKLDAFGAIEWERTYGSTEYDYLQSIHQTPEGGYFIAGHSNGDTFGGGDKAENAHAGSYDYWVIKLNADGDIEWQNTIGGNQDDRLKSSIVLSDGSYLLVGYSESDISFDKTENCLGSHDFLVG